VLGLGSAAITHLIHARLRDPTSAHGKPRSAPIALMEGWRHGATMLPGPGLLWTGTTQPR
jgi:hypothetical protein